MPSPAPGWAPYPQRLSHQVGQWATVWAQFSKGLHLAHLHQNPVETEDYSCLQRTSPPLRVVGCSLTSDPTDLRRDCSRAGESETDKGKTDRNLRMRERPYASRELNEAASSSICRPRKMP